MNDKYSEILELNKIIDMLRDKASSTLGKSLVDRLSPHSDFDEVKASIEETSEAQSILIKRGHVPFDGIFDIVSSVKRAEVGGVLDTKELIEIAETMRAARILSNILSAEIKVETFGNAANSTQDFGVDYPIVRSLANSLYIHREVETEILDAIISENEVSDSASSELRSIRRRIIQKNQSIRSKLNSITSSSTYQKYLQDNIISMRGDRYVIPVKAEYRSMVSGIIHDQSSSGATLFIEPMSIVEMNNDLRQLRLSETEEIERILSELSLKVGQISLDLISNQEVLARLDFIFAKGKLSIRMKAVEPILNKDRIVKIVRGRHPLIDPRSVVPNTVTLGEGYSTLLITGPNTGGKTVTIKMVGLFSLMSQCGLHIPADFGTTMCVFDNIFVDIGDKQSIENNLSTFSSHMTSIVEIVDEVGEDSLVIFDELGAGTDPDEGASLAIAILEYVRRKNASCIATTHYSELKKYALAKEGIENAAVEFDMESLSPTYKLLIGIPGKSNAFEISKKLGLKSDIIEKAKGLMNNEDIELEEILHGIEENRIRLEEELETARRLRKEVEFDKKSLDEKFRKFETSKSKVLEEARSEAFSILRQAKESSEDVIKRLKKIESERPSRDRDREIEDIRRSISNSIGGLQPSIESMIVPKYSSSQIKNLKPGQDVDIITLNQRGTVISSDDKKKEAVVQVGIMKMTLPYKSLKNMKKSERNTVTKTTRKIMRNKSGNIKREVDLRGMNLEEAIMEVEKYLDDAVMAGHDEVTVIHGIGSGVLKKGIGEILKKNPHVKSMRRGEYGEGGAGVTIVKVK